MTTQALTALERANGIRVKRAKEKRRIKALTYMEGREEVAKYLDDPPEWLLTEKIGRLLCYPRRAGRAFAHRLLLHVANPYWPVGETTRVGMLTPAQRERLAHYLRKGWDSDGAI